MGHQISQEDTHFHLHTSDGQHYLLNRQVGCPIEVGFLTSMTHSSSGWIWQQCERDGTITGCWEQHLMTSCGIKPL